MHIVSYKFFNIEEPTDPHRQIDGEADANNFEGQGSSNPSDGDTDALKAKYLLHLIKRNEDITFNVN